MNRFLAAMAIAAFAGASPALAQSYDPDVGTGNIAPAPYSATTNIDAAYNARAQALPGSIARGKTDIVTDEAGNVERDPDINIRSQIHRENNEF